MPTIAEIRQQYPQYGSVSDQQLADALHDKFYSSIPKDEFYKKIGVPEPSAWDKVAGAAKAAGSGLVEGVANTAGLPGDVGALIGKGVRAAAGVAGVDPATTEAAIGGVRTALTAVPGANAVANGPTSDFLQKQVEDNVTGPLYQPQNTAEKYIRSVASMAPAIATGPGGIVRRAAEQVLLPGIAAQAAGDLPGVQGTAAEPVARAIGAMAAPSAVGRVVSPLTTAPTRAAAVQNLANEGVDVTAGQATGSKFLRKAEGELGGSSAQALAERQGEQFTAAVMRRVGVDAPRATPDVVAGAFNRIGNDINTLAANNMLLHDAQLTREINTTVTDYNDIVPPTLRSPLIARVEQAVNHQTQGVVMTGDEYQALRSRLGGLARSLARDPQTQRAVYGVQNALDDAMERSIQQQNPQNLGEWQQARTQYRNLLAVEKAVNFQGEAAQSGLITPQNLARALKTVQGQRAYSTGRTDLAVLARNGSEVMAPLANSETASRGRIHAMMSVPSAMLGAGLGVGGSHLGLSPMEAIGAAATGAAVPRAVGEGLIRGRRYLGNRVIQNRQTLPSFIGRGLLAQ